MQFSKWHALGNAYLVVDRAEYGPLDAALVVRLCNTERGVGADGVVEFLERDGAHATILIWNPDGSTAELSGNGVRIAACVIAGASGANVVEIRSGERTLSCRMLGGGLVETEMGAVTVNDTESIALGSESLDVVPATVGNPHAVVRFDGCDRDDLLRVGPQLEHHARFPARTNVQLVEPVGANELRVLVWERGAGETPSSGSSATAAAAVAVAHGWCRSPVTVHLPGGDLIVTVSGGRATLVGPAEHICTGDVTLTR
ncbi:MAG: diaminopimelate epimerase [Thermoleophilia bacterium]|nr:diaminopimelate epimerase [Thermoleophilia bacterium]